MRNKWIVAAAGVVACAAAPDLAAQNQGIALVPLGAYVIPGVLASEDNSYEFAPKASPFLGGQIELGLSKNLSFGVGGGITVGQKLDLNDNSQSSGNPLGTADVSSARVYGLISLRPGGRRPNGTVTPLAIEFGGGITMWKFDKFVVGSTAITPVDDFNSNVPFGFAGIAYNVPIGPRTSLQLFGRAMASGSYSSDGLDSFNAAPPPSNVEGKTTISFMVGAGLRVGR